jgi:serine/threonine protein kinase
MIAPGTVLAGKYTVERVLGEGGMGVVVAATHLELGHKVAIKLMLPQASEHAEMLARFEREARAAAGLSSEHAARVTDVGRLENGMPFMVMEFLEGEDLGQRIARERQLSIAEVVRLFTQACMGLHDAHANGIVHRDVKPANLFLATRTSGRVVLKVLDFGIAKAEPSTTNPSLTRTTAVLGSPQYMSPEQLSSTKTVDARTDIWSLGAAFYEALTGVAAFPSQTLAELHVKILMEPPVAPRALRPEVPADLEGVLLKCLAKAPDERYASMADVQRDLEIIAVRFSVGGTVSSRDLEMQATALPGGRSSTPVIRISQPPAAAPSNGLAGTAAPLAQTLPFAPAPAPTPTSRVLPMALSAAALVIALGCVMALRSSHGGASDAAAHAASPPISVVSAAASGAADVPPAPKPLDAMAAVPVAAASDPPAPAPPRTPNAEQPGKATKAPGPSNATNAAAPKPAKRRSALDPELDD